MYNISWSPPSKEPLQDNNNRAKVDCSFLLISLENEELSTTAVSAFHKLGVSSDDITSVLIQDVNCDIQEKFHRLFKEMNRTNKSMIILNMLPMSARALPLEASFSTKAEWLCFESNLEIIKLLSKLHIDNSKLISISYNIDDESRAGSSKLSIWGGISRGMSVSADLEVRQRVISAEIRCDADEKAFIKLILESTRDTVEERMAITDKQLLQPTLKRYDFKVRGFFYFCNLTVTYFKRSCFVVLTS